MRCPPWGRGGSPPRATPKIPVALFETCLPPPGATGLGRDLSQPGPGAPALRELTLSAGHGLVSAPLWASGEAPPRTPADASGVRMAGMRKTPPRAAESLLCSDLSRVPALLRSYPGLAPCFLQLWASAARTSLLSVRCCLGARWGHSTGPMLTFRLHPGHWSSERADQPP